MEWALSNDTRIKASPEQKAICPVCKSPVMAKCGDVNVWHWAHQVGGDCDPWSEGETQWHINWKNLFQKEWQEVVIGQHRADIKTPTTVIELQHSPISAAEICEREIFYDNMIWLFDLRRVRENIILSDSDIYGEFSGRYRLKRIQWRWPRKSYFACTKPVLFHFGKNELYNVFGFINFNIGYAFKVEKPLFMKIAVDGHIITDNEAPLPIELLAGFQMIPNNVMWQDYQEEHAFDEMRSIARLNPLFTGRSPVNAGWDFYTK